MTTVTIYRANGDTYKGFTCKGHAGFRVSGKDIYCAAISILVINTLNSIEEIAKQDMETKTDATTGYIDCRFVPDCSDKTKLFMDSMILGLESIIKQGGKKYLRLTFEEV
jgi:uncharacterized protein YsxB (DUF464 family)